MFDGSFQTFERIKRPNTVQVFALQGDDIVFAWEEQPMRDPFYGVFCGMMEKGEEPLESAKRELLEESGLASDEWELLFEKDVTSKIDWTIYTYVARNCYAKEEQQKLDVGEKIDLQKMLLEDFLAEIIPHKEFRNKDLRTRIYCAPDNEKIEEFKQKLLG